MAGANRGGRRTAVNKTVSTSHVRSLNLRLILDAIFQRKYVSKAELARILNMSKPAMSDNVRELMELGIVRETEEAGPEEGRGRRPTMLCFHETFKYLIGVDFHYSKTVFMLSNLKGEPIQQFSIRQTPQQDFESWVAMCQSAISTLMSAQAVTQENLAAIGVSSPGIISRNQDSFINSGQFGAFNGKNMYDALREAFSCPVYIKNSTNASALGEWDRGAGQGTENLLYVSCGQGLGAGMIIHKALYEGKRVAAGEIANFITAETLATGRSLENRICIEGLLGKIREEAPRNTVKALGAGQETCPEFERVVECWRSGDVFLRECVSTVGMELGRLIGNLVMTLNCDKVIFGGEYRVFEKQLLPEIQALVDRYCIIPAPVELSALGELSSLYGMLTMCRERYFDHVCKTAL